MGTSRRKAGRIRKRSATIPTTPVRRESSENSPFTVTLKYFEGDSARFEERLLYARNLSCITNDVQFHLVEEKWARVEDAF